MHILHLDKTDPRAQELVDFIKKNKFDVSIASNRVDIKLDEVSLVATRGANKTTLTKKEFALLALLIKNEGSPVSRDQIIREVWKMSIDPFSNTLEAHIRSLRKKLGAPLVIHTVPRVGYKLSLEP